MNLYIDCADLGPERMDGERDEGDWKGPGE